MVILRAFVGTTVLGCSAGFVIITIVGKLAALSPIQGK